MHHLRPTFFFALLLLLVALAARPASAQGDTISVLDMQAQAEFPTAITFTLSATSRTGEISAAQLLYGASRSEALTIVEVEVVPGAQVSLSHRLDTQVVYFPPGTELRYRWVLRDAAGNSFETPAQEFLHSDTRFPWRERRAGNLIVAWYDGDDAFGDALLTAGTTALDRLQRDIGAELGLPVRIYVYSSLGDMRSALQANEVEWVGGQAWADLGVIVGAIAPGNDAEIGRLIPHELSHQVLHQATENPYGGMPTWFNEGLAVYNQSTRDASYDDMVAAAAREGRLIPLRALAAGFPTDPDQALLSYAQSRAVVTYLMSTYGAGKVQALVQAFQAATPLDAALEAAIGRDVEGLDADWRRGIADLAPQATPVPPSQLAPDSRFSEPAVLPPAAQPAAPQAMPTAAPQTAWIGSVEQLPAWAQIGGAALCCIVGAAVFGSLLLAALRLLGVDKRTS